MSKSKKKLYRHRTLALAVSTVSLLPLQALADTQSTVVTGQTDLTAAATYTPAGTPTSTTDVIFTGSYSPTAFTVNTSLGMATLNDLSTTGLTIDNKSTTADVLTLNGGSDGATGSNVSDLLFVGTGGNITIGGASTTALGLALANSGNIDVLGSLTLGSNTALSGAVNVTKTGTGTLILNSVSNAEGGVGDTFTVEAGTLQIGNNGTAAANFGAIGTAIVLGDATVANVTLTLSAGGKTGTYANPLTVSAGGGTKTINDFSGVFTFNGPVTLNSNLQINNTNSAASPLTFTGGVTTTAGSTGNLTLNGTAAGSTIVFSGSNPVNNIGSITNIGTNAAATVTISSAIGANVTGVIENATSTMVLSGANLFTGPTTITKGTLSINTIGNDGTSTPNALGETSGANSTITIGAGGTLQYTGSTLGSSNRPINLVTPAGGTFSLDASGSTTFALSGAITSSGTSGTSNLTFTGSGSGTESSSLVDGSGSNVLAVTRTGNGSSVWILSGANTYSGATTISAGTLEFANTGAVSPNSVFTVNLGATLGVAVDGVNGFADSGAGPGTVAGVFAGTIGSSGAVTYNTGANVGLDTTNVPGGLETYSSNIANVGVTKLGTGSLLLTGNLSAQAAVNVLGGTLTLSGNNSFSGTGVVYNGGTLQLQANSGNTTSGVSSAYTSATPSVQHLQLNNGSTLQLRSDNTVSGNIVFSGTSNIGGLNNATVAIDVGQVSGTGGNVFTISPNAVTPIGNAVTFNITGANGDSLAIGSAIDSVTGTGTNFTLNPTTASVALQGGYYNFNNGTNSSTLTLGGTIAGNSVSGKILNQGPGSTGTTGTVTVTKNGASVWTLSAANTYTGATNVNGGSLIFAGAGTLPSGSTINLSNATISVLNDGAGSGGNIAQGNNVTLANNTTSTLNVANNGSGNTGNTIAFGSVSFANANTNTTYLDVTGANGYSASFTSAALANTNGNASVFVPTTASVVITGNVTNPITATGATHYDTLVLDGTSAGNAIGGVISDSSVYSAINSGDTRVTKQNSSTWTLTGSSTYHGPTAVNAGTLALGSGGNLGATAVTVGGAATFAVVPGLGGAASGASNSLGGNLTLNGANFSMLDGITSTFNVAGTATLNANSTLGFEIGSNGTTTTADLLAVTGAATDANPVRISLTGIGSGVLASGNYNLITAASGLTSTNFTLASGSRLVDAGNVYTATLGGNGTTEYVTISSSLGAAAAYYNAGAGTGTALNATNAGTGATNFSSDAAGANDFGTQPGSTQDVYFTATNLTSTPPPIPSLGQPYTFNSLNFLSGAPAITVGNNPVYTLTLNAGITDASANNQTFTPAVALGAAQTFSNTGTGTLTLGKVTGGSYALTVTGSGNTVIGDNITSSSTLTKTGTGTLTLGGSTNSLVTLNINSNSIVDIGSGTLSLNNSGNATIQSSTGGTVNATGGGSLKISSNTGSNFGDNGTAAGTTLTINANIISNGTGNDGFEVYGPGGAGSGTVVLTGKNTFKGDVNIDGGTLQVASIGLKGTGDTTSPLGEGTNIDIANGGNAGLRYTGTGEVTDRVINLFGTTSAGFLDQSGTGTLEFSANFAPPGAGAKTLVLQGSTSGVGQLDGIIPNNSATFTTAISKLGTGAWTLAGANTYSGGTTIGLNGGNLAITNASGFGTGTVTVANTNAGTSGTAQLNLPVPTSGLGSSAATPNVIANAFNFYSQSLLGTTPTPGSADIENVSGYNQLTGPLTISNTGGYGANIVSDSGNLELAGTLSCSLVGTAGAVRTFDLGGAGTGSVTGTIVNVSGTGNQVIGIQKDGTGTWSLANANTYSGGTIVNVGTLLANNTSGSATGTGAVTIAKPGTLGGAGTITGGAVTVNGTITAGGGASPAAATGLLTTTGGTAGATTASQVWNGGGNYAWKVNAAAASPAAAASTVNGLGTTDSAPGSNWDMLAVNTLSIQSTSASPFTVNVVPTTAGPLGSSNPYTIADVLTGTVTIGGTTTNYSNNAAGLTSALQALQASGALVLNVPASMNNSSAFTLSAISDGSTSGGDDIVVSYAPAPEPTSLMLLGLGAGGLMLRRRRTRVR